MFVHVEEFFEVILIMWIKPKNHWYGNDIILSYLFPIDSRWYSNLRFNQYDSYIEANTSDFPMTFLFDTIFYYLRSISLLKRFEFIGSEA